MSTVLRSTYTSDRPAAGKGMALSLAIVCLLLNSPRLSANGQGLQAHGEIQETIRQHVLLEFPAPLKVNTLVGKLDPHLRLAQCSEALEAFYPAGARRLGPTTLGVRCLGATPWQIYIPVEIKAFGPAIVSKHALPRGSIIHANDLEVATRDLSTALQGYYTDLGEIEGMELRYSVAGGHIINPQSLKPRFLVKRGDIVTILAETGGLHIQVKGTAMMDGLRGQSIQVKNTRTKRVLQGEVVAARTVKIRL